MEDRNMKFLVLAVFVVLFSSSFVFAFGVSSPYWGTNPLEMNVGEVKEVSFTLVNGEVGTIPEAVVSLVEGAEIAEIISGSEYSVPYAVTDTKIVLRVSIPADARAGQEYNVKFSVNGVEEGGTSTVQLGVGYDVSFPVKVIGEETETTGVNFITIFSIIILIVAILLIYFAISRKKGLR